MASGLAETDQQPQAVTEQAAVLFCEVVYCPIAAGRLHRSWLHSSATALA